MNDELKWQPYPEALSKYSAPNFDECFGYTSLLGLGGAEKVENLKKRENGRPVCFLILHFGVFPNFP